MYLKRITLKGFKSFPERTTLEFGPGTSVIVGPNGSGKSNVTDAVQWALGEQSAAAIRGGSMQDVIFAGAPARQAARSAFVELVLDDSEGLLGLGPEVAIARQLDRNGDGEYRLAGARCRLIDVLETLSDTGLGKEMHSVISQGKVESIVTSKPRDRRLVIEEAAGLGKHRKRRHRASLKLDRTRENLDRALDVEREARSRLRPLKRQAEAAEVHQRLRRQELEARWELARDELLVRETELVSAAGAAEQAHSEVAKLDQRIATVAAERAAAEEALAQRSSHREELSRRSFTAQSAADRVGLRADAIRATLTMVSSRLSEDRERVARLTAELAAQAPDDGAAERIAAIETELEALARDREAELARQLAQLEGERVAAAAAQVEREGELEVAAAARMSADAACETARGAVREAERELERCRRESARVGGELAAVNQFLRSHQRAPGGGGSLADALSVAPGFELAIAAALDGRLGAALSEDRASAMKLLDRAGDDGGRVLISAGGGAAGGSGAFGSAEGAGAVGAAGGAGVSGNAARLGTLAPPCAGATRLADCVRGEDGAAALARALLADAWLVDDLDQVAADFVGVAVTDRGRALVPSSGELRQAAAVGEDRVLAQRNRREQLIAESQTTVQAEATARAAVQQAGTVLSQRERERETAIAGHRGATGARDEAAEAQRRLVAAIARRRSAPDEGPNAGRRAQLSAELRAERASVAAAERDTSQRREQLARVQARIARDESLVAPVGAILAELREITMEIAAHKTRFDQELAADRQAGEEAAARLRSSAQAEAALQSERKAAADALTGAQVRAERARDGREEAVARLTALAGELELEAAAAEAPLSEAQRSELQAQLTRIERRREQLGPVNPLAAQEYEEAVEHVQELEAQRTDLETAIRELVGLIRDTDKQISDTFDETFQTAARNFEELAARVFPGGRGRLRLVDDRAGAGGAATGRAAGDAAGAADDAVDDADDEQGGGSGGPEQLGVEIEITPAGKTTKALSLLSGGEKSMTALAFLFSVFLAKPCPFYILDEVEAALDDLNISRFLDLLETYSGRAQFIVVTHQKRTMEAADSLYGVSMGGDGISKVISRRLGPARATA